MLHTDRLFSPNPSEREVARRLYESIKSLPIISPHGHTNPRWFSDNRPFTDPSTLFIKPDHYLLRMLYSQGVSLDELGIPRADGTCADVKEREIWRRLATHFHLFHGTPSGLWLTHSLAMVFDVTQRLGPQTADAIYDHVANRLLETDFRPRQLFERFNIEVLCTTDSPLDDLRYHDEIRASRWAGRIIPSYRPDVVVDPEIPGFTNRVERFGELTGIDVSTWTGYLQAHAQRRQFFIDRGATSTDHGHLTPRTADLGMAACEQLYDKTMRGQISSNEAELFRAQVLTEMARMSLADGLVMQIHPGVARNHNQALYRQFGADIGTDMPLATSYVDALRPLLDRFGNAPELTIILFTLDESTYTRELAPLAGHYPCLRLGPAWWFHDSPEGMLRYRRQVTETAGFYNTVGFNDDTRAFLSIPARHDVARRIDCRFLAELVCDHRLDEDEAQIIARDLTIDLVKKAYRL